MSAYVKTVEESLAHALKLYQEETKKLKKQLEEVQPTPRPIMSYDTLLPKNFNNHVSFMFERTGWIPSSDLFIGIRDAAIEELKAVLLAAEEIRPKNMEVVAHNQKIYDSVVLLMERIGIGKTIRVNIAKKYARNAKYVDQNSGFINDLNGKLPRMDSYPSFKYKVECRIKEIENHASAKIRELQAEENAKVATLKAQNAEKFLNVMIIKYGLEYNAGKYQVRTAILKKNKYLWLAHHLMMNRNDWNDGYDYAETGLAGFEISDDHDQKIYDCIEEIIGNDDIDGRYFRDCAYSYMVLFGMVTDDDLMKDYNTYQEFFGSNDY